MTSQTLCPYFVPVVLKRFYLNQGPPFDRSFAAETTYQNIPIFVLLYTFIGTVGQSQVSLPRFQSLCYFFKQKCQILPSFKFSVVRIKKLWVFDCSLDKQSYLKMSPWEIAINIFLVFF